MKLKRLLALLLAVLTLVGLSAGCAPLEIDIPDELEDVISDFTPTPTVAVVSDLESETEKEEVPPASSTAPLDEKGSYDSKDDVALYLHTYGKLPSNFITKKKAQSLGWSGGKLETYAPGKCIGGDRFGNYESKLPEAPGRKYWECDIGTLGAKSRGAKRIVYSNDGLIYYTGDHYESFTLLYGGAS